MGVAVGELAGLNGVRKLYPPGWQTQVSPSETEIVTFTCGSAVEEGERSFLLFTFLEVYESVHCGSSERMGIKTALQWELTENNSIILFYSYLHAFCL